MEHKIFLPVKDINFILQLKVGDMVYFSGELYVFRDQVHKKIYQGEISSLSGLDFTGAGVYYCAATPKKEGFVVGSCGPTSSYRMDEYTESVLRLGFKVMIGKGYRNKLVTSLCKKYNAIYVITYGGCAAYLSKFVKEAYLVGYPELGSEAMYKFIVKDFPGVVGIDVSGNTLWDK